MIARADPLGARYALTLTALVVACSAACAPAAEVAARPRHVVLVLMHSVRADHVGAYGYAPPTTPRLDALAAGGVVFERAYAASSAAPQSLSALWTGRLPSSGGSTGLREATPHRALVTLPRLFLRGGFRTGLVSSHGGLRERAFTSGFDDVEVDSQPGRWTAGLVTDKALELVEAAGSEPFFLVVDYADAGEPHLPPEEYRARFDAPQPDVLTSLPELRAAAGELPADVARSPGFLDLVARYDAEIAYVDACLGALVDGLSERGLFDDTLLVVTSPHGTELLDHGYVGSAWTLYDEVLRVPLVVHAGGTLAPGRVTEPVSLVDLAPTLQHVFGLERSEHALDGEVLLDPTASGLAPRAPVGEAIAELVVPELCILRACVREEWKLIETVSGVPPEERLELLASYESLIARMQDGEIPRPDPWGAPVRRELYDLDADPGETDDRAASATRRADYLSTILARYAESCLENGLPAARAARRAEVPESLEQLQQLGYL